MKFLIKEAQILSPTNYKSITDNYSLQLCRSIFSKLPVASNLRDLKSLNNYKYVCSKTNTVVFKYDDKYYTSYFEVIGTKYVINDFVRNVFMNYQYVKVPTYIINYERLPTSFVQLLFKLSKSSTYNIDLVSEITFNNLIQAQVEVPVSPEMVNKYLYPIVKEKLGDNISNLSIENGEYIVRLPEREIDESNNVTIPIIEDTIDEEPILEIHEFNTTDIIVGEGNTTMADIGPIRPAWLEGITDEVTEANINEGLPF